MGELALRSWWPAGPGRRPTGRRGASHAQADAGATCAEESVALIHEATEDHPLTPHAVEALVRALRRKPALPEIDAVRHDRVGRLGRGAPLVRLKDSSWRRSTGLPPRPLASGTLGLGMSFTEELARQLLEERAAKSTSRCRGIRRAHQPDERGGFSFRNGLVRDVAYEGLPFRRRRELHARVGEAIESDAGAGRGRLRGAPGAPLPAFERGGEGMAVRADRGARAAALYANVEARDFYLEALEAARRLTDADPSRWPLPRRAGEVRVRLGEYEEAEAAFRLARRSFRGASRRSGFLQGGARFHAEGRLSVPFTADPRAELLRTAPGTRPPASEPSSRRLRSVRWAQGRYGDAVKWCRAAIEEGERAGGSSRWPMLAHLDLPSSSRAPGEAVNSPRALELYESSEPRGSGQRANNLGGWRTWRVAGTRLGTVPAGT